MLKIGLTGGIGSGKSTVAKVFEVLGIPVYYADDAAKRLMQEDDQLKQQLIAAFGPETYIHSKLNREHLSSIVFKQKEQLELLNSLVHPSTIADANRWFALQSAPYVIKEAALLFESGTAEGLDYIIGVTAPETIRIKRVMDRDGVSAEEVKRRMKSQVNEDLKMRLCNYVIRNNDQEPVVPQVMELHQTFLQLAGIKTEA